MAQGDRTGPMGQGSRTGRGFGFCSGYDTPGYAKGFGGGMQRGYGFGRGRGLGRGMNFGWLLNNFLQAFSKMPQGSKEDEIQMLKQTQKDIEKRLNDLEKNQ